MEQKEELITQRWLQTHKDLYLSATRHPFILSIRDGSVDLECFKRWLAQDYFFVRSFVRFAANVLVKLPRDADEADVDTLLGGICALEQEISWFRSEGSRWGVQFNNVALQEANTNYCRFLDELAESRMDCTVALAAFWAIEVVYNDSFAACLEPGAKTPPDLQNACERWGSPKFKMYCMALQSLADKYLQNCPAHVQQQAEQAFVKVLSSEVDFWNMSVGNS